MRLLVFESYHHCWIIRQLNHRSLQYSHGDCLCEMQQREPLSKPVCTTYYFKRNFSSFVGDRLKDKFILYVVTIICISCFCSTTPKCVSTICHQATAIQNMCFIQSYGGLWYTEYVQHIYVDSKHSVETPTQKYRPHLPCTSHYLGHNGTSHHKVR